MTILPEFQLSKFMFLFKKNLFNIHFKYMKKCFTSKFKSCNDNLEPPEEPKIPVCPDVGKHQDKCNYVKSSNSPWAQFYMVN